MIIVDNCIISSLAKIERLELLKNFQEVYTTYGVVEEAFESDISSIVKPLSEALDDWLDVSEVSEIKKIPDIQDDHPSLSYIDCELMFLCHKKGSVLFTDDTTLIEIAEKEFDISTYDLCEILTSLKNEGIISLEEIENIIERLEKKDRYRFSEDDISRMMNDG